MCPKPPKPTTWSWLVSLVSSWFPFLTKFGLVTNPLPGQDPFYHDTDKNLTASKPGTILKTRKIDLVRFPGLNASTLKAWQILYRTTGQLGEPQCTVATVIVPPGHSNRIVSYQSKTDSAFSSCRTSYSLRAGNNDPFGAMSEFVFMEALFDKKWIVIVPDYESSTDAFGAGKQSGHAVLDGIRAFLSSSLISPPISKPKVALWGYSGGALASGWAVSIQAEYAPELKPVLVGAAFGGTPVDLGAIALHTNGGIAAGLIVGCIRGLANAYPALNKWLSENIAPAGATAFDIARTKCFEQIMWKSKDHDVLGTYFKLQNPLEEDVPAGILREAVMGNEDVGVPGIPLFIVQSIHDEVVPVAIVDALVQRWVDKGAVIQYVRDELSAHVILAFTSTPASIEFLNARFEEDKDNLPTSSNETVNTIWLDDVAQKQLGSKRADEVQNTKDEHYSNGKAWWSGPPAKDAPVKPA